MNINSEFVIFDFFQECILEHKFREWNTFRKKNRKLIIDFSNKDLSKEFCF